MHDPAGINIEFANTRNSCNYPAGYDCRTAPGFFSHLDGSLDGDEDEQDDSEAALELPDMHVRPLDGAP